MDNSICYNCTSRYICGESDRCPDGHLYEKFNVIRDDITKCVVDCELYKKEQGL